MPKEASRTTGILPVSERASDTPFFVWGLVLQFTDPLLSTKPRRGIISEPEPALCVVCRGFVAKRRVL